ncbi:sugar phosphate isomerase/epimerase family protein [Polaribacter filamentus]|uniref:sugar phosphate isomerase/epimerase family protein n=1 Tax=Polaribacter filamentus TaxID=53483 RepID=UPI000CF2A14D|nr:TIM barrel protein [Polaribacter filamentus]
MKKIILLCLLSLQLISCFNSRETARREKTSNNPFFAYNFGGLENLPPAQQIKLLKDNGYDGITLRMAEAEHVVAFNDFFEVVKKTEGFKIYSVFVRYNFADSEEDRNRWKAVVDIIQNRDIDLWFIFGKQEIGVDDEKVEDILRNVVDYSASKNVSVTLYPHSWCYFETAEQSLPMVKKINHPNLKLAVHTCHELKAGNAGRLPEIVHKVKDYISFVTIAGASKQLDTSSRKAMDATTIQPLEDGVYDFGPFLKALKKADFKGPIGYINFKIAKEPEDYLSKSLAEWKRLKNIYLNY